MPVTRSTHVRRMLSMAVVTALAVGAATGRRAWAAGAVAAGGVLTYFANTLGPSIEWLAWSRDFSPFHYYSGGQPLRRRHPQLVAFFVAGMPDRPGNTPVGHPVEESLPFLLGEHFGVPDLVDPRVFGHYGSSYADRSCPGTTSYLVDSDDSLVPDVPHPTFHRQVGDTGLERLAKARNGAGHVERIPGSIERHGNCGISSGSDRTGSWRRPPAVLPVW